MSWYVVNIDNLLFEGATYEVSMPRLSDAFSIIEKYVELPFRVRLRRLPR